MGRGCQKLSLMFVSVATISFFFNLHSPCFKGNAMMLVDLYDYCDVCVLNCRCHMECKGSN